MMRTSFFVFLVVFGVANQSGFAQDASPGQDDGSDSTPAPESSARAYLGVGLSFDVGVVQVEVGSPAERAGIKVGDRIVSLDGRELDGANDFVSRIAAKKPGDPLTVGIERGRERLDIDVTLGARDPAARIIVPRADATGRAFLGVGYGEVPVALAVHLGLGLGDGVLVGDVYAGSAAESAGIVTHDVIVKINEEVVEGRRGLVELIGRRNPGESVVVEIIHRGKPVTKNVVLGERPRALPRFPPRLNDPLRSLPPLRPRGSWRGRLRIGPDSVYDIPWGEFDESFRVLPGQLRDWLEDGGFGKDIRKHLEEAFKDFDTEIYSRSRSTVRVVEGDLDITVTSDGGETLVTVERSGQTVAKDLPLEKLDTLPADVREAVRGVIEKYRIELEPSAPPPAPMPPAPVPDLDGVDAGKSVKI